ncbi:hypothetical protein [Polynucleobacter sp. UB-Tiil-W10]|uniref:hypothetical protein n=1 Tax=Polynucleobacter sp. UB-Tiil-W10 TaxID=1855648 RepID=UPI001C20D64C|nr:hypothetical protein [Polynucleobacter sp. UB-Tiil-W10]
MNKKILLASLIATSSILMSVGVARADESLSPIPKISNEWTIDVTPYVWAPNISSTLNYKGQYLNTADVSMNDVISNLKSGGMIAGEAHYGSWGVMADLVSATLQKTGTTSVTPASGYNFRLAMKPTVQQTILTGAATYNLLNNQNANVDGLLGVRWISITATLNLALDGTNYSLSDSKTVSTVDPIVGFKGRYRIADSTWYVPFYADIGSGGGTTNLTWQAMAGVGKTFEKWVDVALVYRSLYYDMSSSKTNGAGLLQKTTFQGPQLSATFHF